MSDGGSNALKVHYRQHFGSQNDAVVGARLRSRSSRFAARVEHRRKLPDAP